MYNGGGQGVSKDGVNSIASGSFESLHAPTKSL